VTALRRVLTTAQAPTALTVARTATTELRSVVVAARELRRRAEPFALATLVRVHGSSYRQPGARMLMTRDRWVAGSISGGCLERDLLRKAWWRTEAGGPALVTYDSSSDEDEVGWGLGLGCNGVCEILLERVTDARGPLAFVERWMEGESRGALVTVFRSRVARIPVGARLGLSSEKMTTAGHLPGDAVDRMRHVASSILAGRAPPPVEGDDVELLAELLVPPPHLLLFGSAHDAVPVVAMAKAVGWNVTVRAPSGRLSAREHSLAADRWVVGPAEDALADIDACHRPLVVIMSHDYRFDRDALGAALRSRARYIGVLGPRRRTDRMLAELGSCRDTTGEWPGPPRLHAPVGLALGAETPAEIALSIVAEAQAVLAGADAAPLAGRPGPIHARANREQGEGPPTHASGDVDVVRARSDWRGQ
jgi:xanthine/CO dehydrogenase XdhC/CoxF family maturation factor